MPNVDVLIVKLFDFVAKFYIFIKKCKKVPMQEKDLENLVKQIQTNKCETQYIELKAAHEGCPKRLYDSLSSFSNQDEGGIVVFGIDEKQNYDVVGVYDAQDLQKKINEQCKEMEPCVRPLFTVCSFDQKKIVSAEIPGVEFAHRPVFYKGTGRIKGSFVRVGDSDEPMSEYEVYSYEAYRRHIRDDARVIPDVPLDSLNKVNLDEYIQLCKKERKNLAVNVSDTEILELMGVLHSGVPTVAGILSFSKFPQGYLPQLCITAVRVPGEEMGDLGSSGERFIDNARITGTIPQMLNDAIAFVQKNSRHKTIIDKDGKRTDRDEYPSIAVREIILNALVHRDYSIYSENVPVRIEMYDDRLQVINSGGLYGKNTLNNLGKIRPDTRNAVLANILEILKITENRYSGIPTIQKEMQSAGLAPAEFSVRHGEFCVTLYNSVSEQEYTGKPNDILTFCSVPRSRAELQAFTGKSRFYTMSHIIQPLLDSGTLKLTMPEKPQSSKQRYVKA